MKKFELKEELNRGVRDSTWLEMFKRWTVAVKVRRECKTVKLNIFRVCAHQGRFWDAYTEQVHCVWDAVSFVCLLFIFVATFVMKRSHGGLCSCNKRGAVLEYVPLPFTV